MGEEVPGGIWFTKVVTAGIVHDSSSWAGFVAGAEDIEALGSEAVAVGG